jgi:hypothetical protein
MGAEEDGGDLADEPNQPQAANSRMATTSQKVSGTKWWSSLR